MTSLPQHFDSSTLARTQELAAEIRRRVDQLSAINKVAAVVSQSLDLNITLQTAMDAVLSVIPVEASGISLIDERAGELVLRAQRGWRQDFVTTPMRIKLGHGLSGQVVSSGEVMVTGNPSNDPRLFVPAVAEENIQAMAMAPMHARGKVVGVLSVISYTPYSFDEQEIAVLKAIADQVGIALDNARLYESTREQQRRLLAVLQSTADAIIATDGLGRVNVINRAAESLFGLSSDSVLGTPLEQVAFPSEIRAALTDAIKTLNTSNVESFEVMLNTGRFLSAVVSPVAMVSGVDAQVQNGWVVVFQDITHIKEAERARLQFVQTAAHDLRNPLGVTLSALTMLRKGWKDPTPTEVEVFAIALRGVNRMQDLIDDLLNLERIESGLDFTIEPVNVADLIERSAVDVGPLLVQRNQRLTVELEPGLAPLYGNNHWLFRALANLLSNAHKYGSENGDIVLRAYAQDDNNVLEVQDDGPGIPLDSQTRLFERFFRVPETSDKVHGTGLGLAIVKSVIERHHGWINVRSVPGQGSIFSLVLPTKPQTAGDEQVLHAG